jgi:hypothetical protein
LGEARSPSHGPTADPRKGPSVEGATEGRRGCAV